MKSNQNLLTPYIVNGGVKRNSIKNTKEIFEQAENFKKYRGLK